MAIAISGILIIIGFFLLIKGADWLVNGASSLAKRNKVSDLAIGLTIVAFGTSMPELVVNTIASFNNQSDIVLANVIGSNNFNLFVILGIVGIIFPISVKSSTAWKEIPISLVTILVLYFLANELLFQESAVLSMYDGFVLLFLFIAFLYYVYKQLKTDAYATEITQDVLSKKKIILLLAGGLVSLIVGGKLVVDNAVAIAVAFNISNKIIGLTIIAAGTSLPELMTSVVAAFKKKSDIAIGNVIGSNIFNLLFVLPISVMVNPIEYNGTFDVDILVLLTGTALLLLAMITGKRKKLDRWEAIIILLLFCLYTIYALNKEL